MIKRRKLKDYVCPVCFKHPNECTCPYYSQTLILIDERLQYAIQQLNKMCYYTLDCCEGHFEDKIPNTYISFIHEISSCPKGFKIEDKKIIRHIYSKSKSKEEFEKEKTEAIENLNNWVNEIIKNRWK